MTKFNRLEFVESLRPVAPFRDWRIYSLLVPAAFSAVGFFVFAVLGYSFTEFAMIPASARFALVVVGGVCLAIGGEIGTLTSTTEIYRKEKLGQAVTWDWLTMGISLATTLASFVIAFAALLGARAGWSRPVQIWGAIFLGALSALDAYGLFLEVGFLFADYEQRMEAWFNRMDALQTALPVDNSELVMMKSELVGTQAELARLRSDLDTISYPVASRDDWVGIVGKLNGGRAEYVNKPAFQVVADLCKVNGYRFTGGKTTAGNWAKLLREK